MNVFKKSKARLFADYLVEVNQVLCVKQIASFLKIDLLQKSVDYTNYS